MTPRRIAVVWARFGPYHVARLRATAALAGRDGGEIAGIEVASSDGIYAWDPVADDRGFVRKTLFPGARYETLSRREIGAKMFCALDLLAPEAVAVNGWSVAEAQAAIAWAVRRGRVVVLMSESKTDDLTRRWWKETLKRGLIGLADSALVGGRLHRDYLESLGFPSERVVLGYDAVDNDHFRHGADAARAAGASARAPMGLPQRYFFACTRFVLRKNVDGLLSAYAIYRQKARQAPWALVIAGSGAEAKRLAALERELGLKGVVWPGFLQYEHLPLYYGLASAFVHPAISEPWGLVVNEAAASGLPLLVSARAGAAAELVRDGENGYVIDPLDPEALAAAMVRLAELSDAARAEMGSRSRAIAEQWGPLRFASGLLAAAAMGNRSARARRAA
jgi:glycosyltransferase involved in cell wall biosynthesis